MRRRRYLEALGATGLVAGAGCPSDGRGDGSRSNVASGGTKSSTAEAADAETRTLTLATATTAYDTGLLDALHPTLRDRFGLRVKVLSLGTGASLRTGRDGDADAVLVHARGAEDAFLKEGFGVNRRSLMHNDFLVVGPPDDHAGLAGVSDPVAAFERIARSESLFLSRGDDSGTHRREEALWTRADAAPGGRWHQATGDGMGDTLRQAGRRGAYTLTDRGTYRVFREEVGLDAFVEGPLGGGSELLLNEYGVIPVNPARRDVRYELAVRYVGFLTGPTGQRLIREFRPDGDPLFVPDALSADPQFGQYVPSSYREG